MSQYKKILSICIPTYNRGWALDFSLKAIENELKTIDYKDIEFIVSDNCSIDNTKGVVEKYIQAGIPIIYIRNEKNLGAVSFFVFIILMVVTFCFCSISTPSKSLLL